MFHALLRLFGSNPQSKSVHRSDRRIRLSLEALEDRVVPAAIWTVDTTGDTGSGFKNPNGSGGRRLAFLHEQRW